jgi:hypothetical protein
MRILWDREHFRESEGSLQCSKNPLILPGPGPGKSWPDPSILSILFILNFLFHICPCFPIICTFISCYLTKSLYYTPLSRGHLDLQVHPPWSDCSNDFWWWVATIKLSFYGRLHSPVNFSTMNPIISFRTVSQLHSVYMVFPQRDNSITKLRPCGYI